MRYRLPLLLVFFVLLIGGCASSEVAVIPVPEVEPEPAGPMISLFNVDGTQLNIVSLVDGSSTSIGAGGDVVFSSGNTDHSRTALAFSDGSRSSLYVFSGETLTPSLLHEGRGNLVYSADWSADGETLFFGYYTPNGKRMGAGSIRKWTTEGGATSIGCSASRQVLAEMPDGSLLVRNSDNIYQVSVDGCDTLKTIDARKMYHVSVSPDGTNMAYIQRELEYNRDSRQYEPDSMLFVQPTAGGDPQKVVGDKYNPRNLTWSPDGAELAYDVLVPGSTDRRAISIYSVGMNSSGFMTPPDATTFSQHGASYSSDGMHMLYTGVEGDQSTLLTRANLSPFGTPVPEIGSAFATAAHWMDADHLFLIMNDGQTAIYQLGSGIIWDGDSSVVFAKVW